MQNMGLRHSNKHAASMMSRIAVALLLLCIQPVAPALALTATNNLSVSVLVPAKVQMTATPMNFGSTFNAPAPLQASASITVNILSGTAYNITIDAGLNIAGERRVTNGAGNFRSYLLYKDATRTQLWGDSDFTATYAAGSSLAATGTGATQTFTVYADSPGVAAQLPAGIYSDAVTVTVNY